MNKTLNQLLLEKADSELAMKLQARLINLAGKPLDMKSARFQALLVDIKADLAAGHAKDSEIKDKKIGALTNQLYGLMVESSATELSVELARIDATISSRLPTSSYTAPNNTTINSIGTRVQQLPLLTDMEASTILAKKTDVEVTVDGGFTQTDRDTLTATKINAANAFAIGASK